MPCMQYLHDKRPHIFEGMQADAMVLILFNISILFMWQDDMVGVVRIIDECLEIILHTSDQP